MASWVFKAAVSIALAAHSSNAQLATPTPNGNLSVSATPSPGPTATGGSCCIVVPMNVGLNFWFNSTLTRTVATVITQVYQYNTTAVTSTITVSHNGSYDDVPASIIPGQFIYSRTMTGTETEVSLANTLVASPTPFVEIVNVGVIYGTWSISSNTLDCDGTSTQPLIVLPTGYGYVEDPPISRTTHVAYANPPPGTELLDFWIQHEPTITKKLPGLKTCSIPSGSGEPSVHVPVTGLTDHLTSTIRMGGGGPAPPVSKTNVPAEPITTKQPAASKAPEPEPTSKAPAKPSEPERPPPVPTGSNPNPGPNPNPNPNNPQQPPNPENPQQPSNPSSPPQPPNPDDSQHHPNPQQPPPATTGSSTNPSGNPNPNSPQQPAPIAPGQPGNTNPSNASPSQRPAIPLPINLTPAPAPAPGPTSAGAPPVATQPINPPAVILPNGETLQPGTLTTISDHTISIPTVAPSVTISNESPVQGPPIIVVDGTTATLAPSAVILPNGETLQPGSLTTISDHTVSIPTDIPSMTVINGTPVQAPPIVVVDGTTATLAPTSVATPVAIPITMGEGASASVVSITAAPTPGGGVVLPNGETLLPGSTVTYLGETLVLTTAPEGGSTVVQVIDSSTTEMITVPTAASSSVFVYGNGSGTTTGSSGGSGTPSQTTSSAPEEATGAGEVLLPRGAAAVLAVMGAAVVLGL